MTVTRLKPRLRIVAEPAPAQRWTEPSLSFVRRTRNPSFPSPTRFEPTSKNDGDVVIVNPALAAWMNRKEVA